SMSVSNSTGPALPTAQQSLAVTQAMPFNTLLSLELVSALETIVQKPPDTDPAAAAWPGEMATSETVSRLIAAALPVPQTIGQSIGDAQLSDGAARFSPLRRNQTEP